MPQQVIPRTEMSKQAPEVRCHNFDEVALGFTKEEADEIREKNSLPAICGRVCPQENQCEGQVHIGNQAQACINRIS